MTSAAAKSMLNSELDIRELIAEKAAFSTAKYHGFERMMGEIGQRAASVLSLSDRLPLTFEYTEAQELRPEYFVELQGPDTIAFRIDFDAVETPGMLIIHRAIFYRWFEAALGGIDNAEPVYPERDPTPLEIEAALIFARRFCDSVLKGLGEIGTAISARVARPEEGAEPGDWVARNSQFWSSFDVCVGEVAGTIMLVMPFRLIEPMRQAIPEKAPQPEAKSDAGWEEGLRSTVGNTHVKLSAVMASKPATLGEIRSMRVGQVIELGTAIHEPITIEVDNMPAYSGYLGQAKGKYVFKYDGAMERE